MKTQETNFQLLKRVAISYGILFTLVGLVGFVFLFMSQIVFIIIDPIKQIILILIGVIFLRGYFDLKAHKTSGVAFLFVGAIVGIVLGALAFLEFFFVGLIQGFFNEISLSSFITRIFSYFFNPALILGFLSLIPYKMIKHREILVN